MTNKEIEDQIAEALLSGKGQLIPISQLGQSSEGYLINTSNLYAELYESYVAMCHSEDADDTNKAFEKVSDNYSKGDFAIYGQRGMFKWFALAAKYPTAIHKMNQEKNQCNEIFSELQNNGGYKLGVRLANAINGCDFFTSQLKSCVIVNTDVFLSANDLSSEDTSMLIPFLMNFWGQKDTQLIDRIDNKYKIKRELIKGKDVIIPFAYFTENTLNFFPKIAKELFVDKCGANTVTAIGLARFVPSIMGEQGKISRNDFLPLISPNPFIEIPRLF